jgi:hypothetical protein
MSLESHAALHYLRVEIAASHNRDGEVRRFVMLNAVLRWIERAMAPGFEMLGNMPPSAVRQVIFSI